MAESTVPYTVDDSSHRNNVAELQKYLSSASGKFIIPDGIYTDETRSAVMEFQRKNNLEPTGETDRLTWDAVYSAYTDNLDRQLQTGINAFPFTEAVLSSGDRGISIFILQAMLDMIASYYINLPVIDINGLYDGPTEKMVSVIQNVSGLPVTGKTDIGTWNFIVKIFNSLAAENEI